MSQKITGLAFSTLLISIFIIGCKGSMSSEQAVEASNQIYINQIGYLTKAVKKVLVKSYAGKFKVYDKNEKVVLEGTVNNLGKWKHSGEEYSEIDFSSLKTAGEFYVKLENNERSWPIHIADNYFEDLCQSTIKSYYFNRASIGIGKKYGGKWNRSTGHPDTAVYIHQSVKNSMQEPGSIISSPGGWYDAGDYNKYIVNSSITVYTLLSAYELFPDVFSKLSSNIPESGNGIPDIINETIYNVRWMLSMQDSDGGVFHKLTTQRFEDFVMPEHAVQKRYVVMKTTAASLDFAASMASCSRIVGEIPALQSLADSCLQAAELAWGWASKNRNVLYQQPKEINTGEYNDQHLEDEWMWAATELYLATRDFHYINEQELLTLEQAFITPSWDLVHTLGLMSIVKNPDKFSKEFIARANTLYIEMVDSLHSIFKSSPALTSLDYFKWGSNSDMANQSMLLFLAYELTKKNKYNELALENINYLLGRNPTGYCFVTGFGEKSPINVHHRPSGADDIVEPIPGMLVGGPNTVVLNDCSDSVKRSEFPALSYTDTECSYSTNEIAINWTAPFIYACAGAINYAAQQP